MQFFQGPPKMDCSRSAGVLEALKTSAVSGRTDGIELFPVAFMGHDGMAVIVECFHDCCGDGCIEAVCAGDALK